MRGTPLRAYASSTLRMHTAARDVRTVSPRVRMATRLYASGTCPTKKAAAEAVGLHPAWLGHMTRSNEETKRIMGAVDGQIMDQTVEMSGVLRLIGREAIRRIRDLMSSEHEPVALKAAIDLADRSTETSKIQRHEIAVAHITSEDAKELAKSLVEAARVREQFATAALGNIVRVNTEVVLNGTRGDEEASQSRLEGAEAAEVELEEDVCCGMEASRAEDIANG